MTVVEPSLAKVIAAHRTCEFTTLARDGTPLTWPTAVWFRPDGTFLVTTSLGFPQKALNVRRDGRVALLFSDPTGSGLTDPPQVLVTGTAACPDEIVTSPEGIEPYWATMFERQPDSRSYLRASARWLTDWYYLRLLITVTPSSIRSMAAHPAAAEAAPAGTSAAAGRILGSELLAEFPSAVLGARDVDGAPILSRTRPVPRAGGYSLDVPTDAKIAPGPASLLVHRHDDRLGNLRNALVKGDLVRDDGGWLLVPQRVVEPSPGNGARAVLRTLRATRRSTRSYLARRGLARPRVQWDQFQNIVDSRPS
ncbi:pyridoxamine 5'-phosphate oxidase family protein [Micromonospora sp. NBC_00858]|uniref:pyridoxamine 5'-phosphate oxidase family protein n=1 Tax=Micromonospora sp. NBC_00858 TaxID=2975979 RepID=UPI003863D90E|nr:pyridoxamine 5'-phosphate oxidase family protein [Micromonospora sp. NBC_00858]